MNEKSDGALVVCVEDDRVTREELQEHFEYLRSSPPSEGSASNGFQQRRSFINGFRSGSRPRPLDSSSM